MVSSQIKPCSFTCKNAAHKAENRSSIVEMGNKIYRQKSLTFYTLNGFYYPVKAQTQIII